jgi:site-specific DNA-cytosine methylase
LRSVISSQDLGAFLKKLRAVKTCGTNYDVKVFKLNSIDFGLAQNRPRVYIVCRGNLRSVFGVVVLPDSFLYYLHFVLLDVAARLAGAPQAF